MASYPVEELGQEFGDLIAGLKPGEVLELTCAGRPVARIVAATEAASEAPILGSMRGTVLYMAPDFNAPLELRESAG